LKKLWTLQRRKGANMDTRSFSCVDARRFCPPPNGLADGFLDMNPPTRHDARMLPGEVAEAVDTQVSVGAQIVAMGGRWAVVRSVEEVADLVHVWGEGTPIRKVRLI
jgi:hypothetical protein